MQGGIDPGDDQSCPRFFGAAPCAAISIRGADFFVPDLLEPRRYEMISGPGMEPYPPWAVLALRTPTNEQSASGVGVSMPCGAV